MTVIAIIPARGGSKSIPRKNLQKVGGVTLVERSIRHAQDSPAVDRVYVSSEDEEILSVAHKAGAGVIKRPDRLATDSANGDEVIVHALNAIGIRSDSVAPDDATVYLLPTSPLRPLHVIRDCVDLLSEYDSVFTGYDAHFAWGYSPGCVMGTGKWQGMTVSPLPAWAKRLNRQHIGYEQKVFVENGACYATRTSEMLKLRVDVTDLEIRPMPNRLWGRIGVVEMSRDDSIDIDTPYDLWLANQRLAYLESKKEEAYA